MIFKHFQNYALLLLWVTDQREAETNGGVKIILCFLHISESRSVCSCFFKLQPKNNRLTALCVRATLPLGLHLVGMHQWKCVYMCDVFVCLSFPISFQCSPLFHSLFLIPHLQGIWSCRASDTEGESERWFLSRMESFELRETARPNWALLDWIIHVCYLSQLFTAKVNFVYVSKSFKLMLG